MSNLSNLSKLLEKIEAKYPDDKDILALSAELENEDPEMDDVMDLESDIEIDQESPEAPESAEPLDIDALLSEDMAEEDEEDLDLEMPPKKKKY